MRAGRAAKLLNIGTTKPTYMRRIAGVNATPQNKLRASQGCHVLTASI
jgi:hypothetical protein